MENQSLLLTLGVGVFASAALFFLFHKGVRWSSKLSALLSILIVQSVYIPLAALNWAGLDVFAIHFGFFTMAAALPGIIAGSGDATFPKTGATVGKNNRFHWVPLTIAGFFVVLAMVDATIITLANKGASSDFIKTFLPESKRDSAKNVTSAFPGTVSNDFQKKYDQYNNYLSQLKAQTERGWKISDGWLEKPYVGKPTLFRIKVVDKMGQAVAGGKVQVSFLRPSNKALDQRFDLPETALGIYGMPLELPAPGLWAVMLVVNRGDEIHEVKGETWVEDAVSVH